MGVQDDNKPENHETPPPGAALSPSDATPSSAEKICPRCAETVKAAARVCRFCNYEFGTPVRAAPPAKPSPPATPPVPKKGHFLRNGCLGIFAIIVVLIVIGENVDPAKNPSASDSAASSATADNATTPAPATDCKSDWTKCSDNEDLVNNYSDWTKVQVECKEEANSEAKYGTPEWPWLPFGSFLKGTDYSTSGIATAIEADAQFQNGFGAMVHSTVTCRYDLRAQKVLDVSILPH